MTLAEIRKQGHWGRNLRHGSGAWCKWEDVPKHYAMSDIVTGTIWELEPEPKVIPMRPGIRGKQVPNGIVVESELDDDFWDTLVHIDHEELDALHTASLRIRGIAPDANSRCEDGAKQRLAYTGVAPKPITAEEAWEVRKFKIGSDYEYFMEGFTLGQQSACPVVEYVEPDVKDMNYVGWCDDAYRRGHKAGWTDHETAVKGGSIE